MTGELHSCACAQKASWRSWWQIPTAARSAGLRRATLHSSFPALQHGHPMAGSLGSRLEIAVLPSLAGLSYPCREGYERLRWLSDNRIAYSSSASGNPEVWAVDADGSHPKQLTQSADFGTLADVRSCAQGRYLLTASLRPGIWRFDADGGNPKQLTTFDNDFYPSCSPDGKGVVFASVRSSSGSAIVAGA